MEQCTDIGMIDFSEESNFGRSHGVLLRQEQLELEYTTYRIAESAVRSAQPRVRRGKKMQTFKGGGIWTGDEDVEVAEVVVVRDGGDAGRRVGD